MDYRNNPRTRNGPYSRHGGHGQGQSNFSSSPSESPISFHFGGNTPIPPEQQMMPLPGDFMHDSSMLPANVQNVMTGELVEKDSSDSKSSGFSLPNLGEIKGIVDRLGGLDGILTGVTKVQKVVSSISQMAPLIKVLLGSFGSKKSKGNKVDDLDEWKPRPRKRRKSSGGGQKRRPTGSASTSTKRRRR